jgi:hypothetical protein
LDTPNIIPWCNYKLYAYIHHWCYRRVILHQQKQELMNTVYVFIIDVVEYGDELIITFSRTIRSSDLDCLAEIDKVLFPNVLRITGTIYMDNKDCIRITAMTTSNLPEKVLKKNIADKLTSEYKTQMDRLKAILIVQ